MSVNTGGLVAEHRAGSRLRPVEILKLDEISRQKFWPMRQPVQSDASKPTNPKTVGWISHHSCGKLTPRTRQVTGAHAEWLLRRGPVVPAARRGGKLLVTAAAVRNAQHSDFLLLPPRIVAWLPALRCASTDDITQLVGATPLLKC